MNDPKENGPSRDEFERTVGSKEKRKIKARTEGMQSPWFGLGMFGLVGWSIVVPTLAGILIGSWIDGQWPSRISWKLTFLFLGLAIGCGNAWFWIQKEMDE